MIYFEGLNAQEFYNRFNTIESYKDYLSEIKWENGFKCVECSHTISQIPSNYSQTFNKCSHKGNPSANTLFYIVKFGLDKAFVICFEMSITTRSLSASCLAKLIGVTPYTARMFIYKIRDGMKSSERFLMKNRVEVDEFVVGGKEDGKIGRSYDSKKKKAVVALELKDKGKVKRMYINQINDFSAKELRTIFDKHISKKNIATDLWRGYSP